MLIICLLPPPRAVANQTGSSTFVPAGTSSSPTYLFKPFESVNKRGANEGKVTRVRHKTRSFEAIISSKLKYALEWVKDKVQSQSRNVIIKIHSLLA